MTKFRLSSSRATVLQATSFGRPTYHVHGSSRIICRTVSSNSTKRVRSDSRFRQLSVQIAHNRDTPDPDFWKSLSPLRPTEAKWVAGWRTDEPAHAHMGLVILFTPGFLSWLEDDNFIPKLLKHISYPSAVNTTKSLIYDVLYACVDGVAPEEHYGTFHGQPVTLGFSFLHVPVKTIWHSFNNSPTGETSSAGPATPSAITFAAGHTSLPRVIVPLANTLFQNGKPSLLVASQWKAQDGGFIKSQEPKEKQYAIVFPFSGIKMPLFSYIPARPVTPFRRIETGLGNIVRTLDFGNGDIGPASRELEGTVSQISERLGGATVDVWALIVPPGVVSAEAEKAPETNPEYVGFWLDRGATMCRVVSGGGGWGPKQGLLSLDPQTAYRERTPVPSDIGSEFPELQRDSALGTLAQTGASIQFLVVDNDQPPPLPRRKDTKISSRKSIVFGTIPSMIDVIPKVSSTPEATEYSYRAGHFGCVSSSGIYYYHESKEPKAEEESGADQQKPLTITRTKIDLPFSYLYMDGRVAVQRNKDAQRRDLPARQRFDMPVKIRRVYK